MILDELVLWKARRLIKKGHHTKAMATLDRAFGEPKSRYIMLDLANGWPIGESERFSIMVFGPDSLRY